MNFITALEKAGWVALQESVRYRKGSWELTFDTSSWVEISTANNPRVFDVPVPEPHLEKWCINLIEHLCVTDDNMQKLKGI